MLARIVDLANRFLSSSAVYNNPSSNFSDNLIAAELLLGLKQDQNEMLIFFNFATQ